MTRGVVVDASALLAWLLGEAGDVIAAVDEALDARGDAPVQCPALLVAEIANGLRMALRRGRMSLAQAVQAASIIDELGLVFDRGDAKVASLLAAADTHGLTAYDALYLELAIRTGARLLTADRALQAAASRAGVQ